MESVTIAHNASAVVRTCDAAGVLHVHIISATKEPLIINRAISTRAEKWVELHYHSSPAECLLPLKKQGFKVAATHLGKEAISYLELDYTQPLAIVFGSESEGVSEQTLGLADYKIRIPMLGMVQSLNLSVSVGIILYEALKQRKRKGFFEKKRLSNDEFERYLQHWLHGENAEENL